MRSEGSELRVWNIADMLSIRESAKFVGTQPQKDCEVLSIILGCVFRDLPALLDHVAMGNASLSALSPGQSPHTGQTSLTSDPEKQKNSLYVPVIASDRSKKKDATARLYTPWTFALWKIKLASSLGNAGRGTRWPNRVHSTHFWLSLVVVRCRLFNSII